ncbi:MAG: hypothetical protein HUJ89_02075 [Bacteroidales bacterium]|nr:hypothetical protein [Bacteroidales bacterium]
MKKLFFATLALIALVAATSSCNQQSSEVFGYATVTFKPQADASYFLKVDAETAFKVTNSGWEKYPYKEGREVRALIAYYSDLKDISPRPTGTEGYKNVYNAKLTAVDTIKIKAMVPHTGDDDKAYGNDVIGLFIDPNVTFPVTIAEDGYLTVAFGYVPVGEHEINVVYGADPDDPYVVELRHNANGYPVIGDVVKGLMCFPTDKLPDTGSSVGKIKLVWYSSVTLKKEVVEIPYQTRTDW